MIPKRQPQKCWKNTSGRNKSRDTGRSKILKDTKTVSNNTIKTGYSQIGKFYQQVGGEWTKANQEVNKTILELKMEKQRNKVNIQ